MLRIQAEEMICFEKYFFSQLFTTRVAQQGFKKKQVQGNSLYLK